MYARVDALARERRPTAHLSRTPVGRQRTRWAMSMTACTTRNTRIVPPMSGVAPPPAVVGPEEPAHRRHDGDERDRAHHQPHDGPDVAGEPDDRAQDGQDQVGEQAADGGDEHRGGEGVLRAAGAARGPSSGMRRMRRMRRSAAERAGGIFRDSGGASIGSERRAGDAVLRVRTDVGATVAPTGSGACVRACVGREGFEPP